MAEAGPAAAGRLTIRVAQALLVAAAAGLWAASRLTWVDLRTFDGLSPPKLTALSGAAWSSALLPLALVLLATAVAALAVRGWALRVLAVLVALASLAAGYLAISTLELPDIAMRAAELARVPLAEVVGSKRYYPGPVITLVTAVCTLIAAVLLMRAASSARGTAAKYLTPAARRSAATHDAGPMSERMIWDELDEGRDPTVSSSPPDDNPQTDADTEGR
jgi:uncharacterized membrane protein (TIGR02234 family)